MNPLISLWLLVFACSVVLSGFFYLAENYSHIIGNFYVITGTLLGSYLLYALISRMIRRSKNKKLQS